jgi:hypothetical protein
MLTEIYIEALLVDEELADHVWEAWDSGLASNHVAFLAWMLIAGVSFVDDRHSDNSRTSP